MSSPESLSVEEYERAAPVHVCNVDGREIVYCTPNRATLWRAQTLLTKEPVTIDWLKSMPKGSRLLDVGANVGMYSMFAARVRDCRVFAFEPESQNYALLVRNIFLNGVSRKVTALCAALSDTAGVSTLYLSSFQTGTSCHSLGEDVDFNLQPRDSKFSQGCISMALDELVRSGAMPVPEYVKIDVDGFEHKVIAGGEDTLRNPAVKSLIVELNPRLDEHLEVIDRLCGLGFDYDQGQVDRAARKEGLFKGVAEYVFAR
jgi:FkbM family methyltransferase